MAIFKLCFQIHYPAANTSAREHLHICTSEKAENQRMHHICKCSQLEHLDTMVVLHRKNK